ncbi:MAG TPA: OmpH family outer membrane protein [Saprospiraceae bacterium]|nr:OmpH family outer membrane protein [Saprospiraceae bacterium]HQW55501.1 OmpH family outer membrane protein [Saprospiraceae bacterium]
MNKIIGIVIMLVGFGFSNVQAQKVAYINSGILMQDLPEIKVADSNLQAFQTQLQKKGDQMVSALQAKYQDLGKKQQSGDISPKDLETQSAALKAEEATIQEFEQDMNKQISEKRQSLYQPILDRLNNLINEVAKDKGYSFVFDSSTGVLLYADEAYDLTAAVKEKLQASASKEVPKATAPATPKPTGTSTPKSGGK